MQIRKRVQDRYASRKKGSARVRIAPHLVNGLKGILGLLLLAGVGVNFVNVLMRYVVGKPFPWTEEVMVFGLVFIVLAGTVVSTALDTHLKIDVGQHLFPRKGQRVMRLFGHAAWIAVSIFLAIQSYAVVSLMMRLGQTTMVTRLPSWIPHSVLMVSFILSACAAVYAIVCELRSPLDETRSSVPETAAISKAKQESGHGL